MILGIDPAKDGAAVLLDQGIITDVWSWRYMKRKRSVFATIHTHLNEEGEISINKTELRDGGIISNQFHFVLEHFGGFHVAIEEAYVSRQNPQSGLRVARFGGELAGGLSARCQTNLESVSWIKATNWRYQIIGLNPYTKREQCKRASLTMIPKLCPSINKHLAAHGQLDHITDALGVALWREKQNEH